MVENFSKAFVAWTKQNGIYDPLAALFGNIDPALYWSAVAFLTLLLLLLLRRSIVSKRTSSGITFGGSNERLDRVEALVQDLRSQHSEVLNKLRGEILYLRQELEHLRQNSERYHRDLDPSV